MRAYGRMIAITTLTAFCASPAFAQQSANFDSCLTLSAQRGAGVGSGYRNHREFMAQCLAGQIPLTTGGPSLAAASPEHVQSYNRCADLSEQRGAGVDSGDRNHREFMTQCMTGQIR
jgi:hypothetical protein